MLKGSLPFSFSIEDLKKTGKGMIMATVGAGAIYLAQYLTSPHDTTGVALSLAALASVMANAGWKFFTNTLERSTPVK